MKSPIHIEIKNEDDAFDYITSQIVDENIVILGGHFMLLYNDIQDCLEPAIWQENKHDHLISSSKYVTGNFPLKTFSFALKLKKSRDANTKIALLVNDHYFESGSFNTLSDNKIAQSRGKYRSEYYRNANIPNEYDKLLLQNNCSTKDTVFQNTLINSKYFNPFLFSETALRKKFNRKLRKEISQYESFNLVQREGQKAELFFKTDEKNEYCLTNNGSCGCSGEVMQFVWEIIQQENEGLVLLVPIECYEAVCVGIEASLMHIRNSFPEKKYNFFVASGFGDNDYINVLKDNEMKLTHFKL